MSMSNEEMRQEALRRVKSKQAFWRLVATFSITFVVLVVIWALSIEHKTFSNFWPIWAALGMGIALAYTGLNAYGPRKGTTDAEVEAEMRKMQDGG